MKRSNILFALGFAALLACKSQSADAGTTNRSEEAAALVAGEADSVILLKDYACGAKGQPPCPMQGWMKSVMAKAAGSGEAKDLAAALDQVAANPISGYDDWVVIAKEGADKARAGDVDGAKTSCKKCHTAYQKKYREDKRDEAWPKP